VKEEEEDDQCLSRGRGGWETPCLARNSNDINPLVTDESESSKSAGEIFQSR
jgi:hypothetical protein